MNTWHGVDLNWAYGSLLGSIYRRLGALDQAHDILHDSLVRLALTRPDSRISQPHAYLRTIVRNVLSDRQVSARRWEPLPDESGDMVIAHAPSAEHLAELNERLRITQAALDNLSPRCREVFWMYRVEGDTQKTIAGKLRISLRVVERHIAHALLAVLAAREAYEQEGRV